MPIIDINEFGGLMPSVAARDLPDTAAQVATDLNQRFPDLRPSMTVGSPIATVEAEAKSIFRTPINGVWLSSADDVDYTPSQVQDTTVERVFLTGREAYPEAWEYTADGGTYRKLGVPAPTVAPAVEVTEVYQFTADNASDYRLSVIDAYRTALTDNLEATYGGYVGGYASTEILALADGAYWLPHGTETTPALPSIDNRVGSFCVPITVNGSSYTVNSSKHLFVVNPALSGTIITYLAQTYLAVPVYANGMTYTFDGAGFKEDVQAIQNPEGTGQLFPDVGIDNVVASYTEKFAITTSPSAEMFDDMELLFDRLILYLNEPTGEMLKKEIAAFYETLSASGGAIDAAAENLAVTIYEMASAVWSTAVDSPFITNPIPSDVVPFVEPS